jgi:hypothetical protein
MTTECNPVHLDHDAATPLLEEALDGPAPSCVTPAT